MPKPHLLLLLALGAPSCVSNPHLSHEAVLDGVLSRAAGEDEVAAALAWAELEALPLDGIDERDGGVDAPEHAAYWRAAAWTWSRPCLESRRRFVAARERSASAGWPDDIGLGGRYRDKEGTPGLRNETELSAAFDVLGILRLGRAPAASMLADAEVREAYGELERAAWAALHEVERARVDVAASRAREAALRALVDEVRVDGVRLAILAERGWVAPGRLSAASAMSRRAERRLADERATLADALAALSRTSGLPPDAPALAAVTAANVFPDDGTLREPTIPPAAELLGRVPRLRAARLAYATAEAVVRRTAAEAWPRVGVGPTFRVNPDSHLVGGLLDVAFPWPGSVRGEVAAAVELRELAREELEDALRETLAQTERRATRLARATEVLERDAPAITRDTAAAWRAARARFSTDPAALPTWTDRLERRIVGCVALVDARDAVARASLDLDESIGPTVNDGGGR